MAASYPYFGLGDNFTASERITHYERSKGMILFWVHSTLLLSWGYVAKEMLAEGGSTANLG